MWNFCTAFGDRACQYCGASIVVCCVVSCLVQANYVGCYYFLLAVTFYYRFSIKAVGFRKSLEKNAVLSKNERLNLIERSMYGFGNILIDDRQFDTPFKDGASYKFGEAFAGQRNMLEASTFLSKVMIALLLGLVLNVAFFEIKTETSIGVNCLSMLEYFSYLHLN